MIVHSIEVEGVRSFGNSFRVPFDPSGITVLCGPNGAGKSTLFEAMRRVLTDVHTTATASDLRPWSNGRAPRIALEFEHDGTLYRITKRFLDKPSACLERNQAGVWGAIETGRRADEAVQAIVGCGKRSGEGLLAILWSAQGKLAYAGAPRGVVETVRESLGAQMTGPTGLAFEARLRRDFYEKFTPKKREAKQGHLEEVEREIAAKRRAWDSADAILVEAEGHATAALQARERADQNRRERAGLAQRLGEAARVSDRYRRLSAAVLELTTRKRAIAAQSTAAEQKISLVRKEQNEIANSEAVIPEKVTTLELRRATWEAAQTRKSEAEAKARLAAAPCLDSADAEARVRAATEFLTASRELKAAEELLCQVGKMDARLRDLSAELDALRAPDQSTLNAVRAVAAEIRETGLRLEGSELHLSVSAEREIDVDVASGVPAGPHRMVPGAEWTVHGDHEISVRFPGIAGLRITGPKADPGQWRRALEKSRTRFDELIAPFECTEVDELAQRSDRRIRIEAEQDNLRRQRTSLMGKRSLAAIEKLRDGFVSKRAQWLVREPSWQTTPPDPAALGEYATRLKNDYETRRRVAQEEHINALTALSAAQSAFDGACADLANLRLRIASAKQRLQDLEGDGKTQDLRQQEAGELRSELKEVGRKLAETEQERSQLPANAEAIALALQAKVTDIDGRIAGCDRQIAEHETTRRTLMSQGAYSNRSQAEEQIVALEQEHDREQLQRDALRRLFEAVEQAKQEALDGVTLPVSKRATGLLAEIAGRPLAEITLSDDLGENFEIRAADSSRPVTLAELSGGEQEQVALAVRLALAEVVAGSGRELVVLDDVLLNTDDVRLARILAILERMRTRLQFVLLTCHPERYAGLDGAVRVEMSKDGENPAHFS